MTSISLGTAGRGWSSATSDLDSNNIGRVIMTRGILPVLWINRGCYNSLRLLVIHLSIHLWKSTNYHVIWSVVLMMRTNVRTTDLLKKMVNSMLSRHHLCRYVTLALRTAYCVRPALSIGNLAELNACSGLLVEIIIGLDLLNHITFWCYYLILIS